MLLPSAEERFTLSEILLIFISDIYIRRNSRLIHDTSAPVSSRAIALIIFKSIFAKGLLSDIELILASFNRLAVTEEAKRYPTMLG